MLTKDKPFEKWKTQEVENTFGIKPTKQSHTLHKWLSAKYTINEETSRHLNKMREKLADFGIFHS